MIWWLWNAFEPAIVNTFDVCDAYSIGSEGEDDIAWLGEDGWAARTDNMGLGLRTHGA